MDSRKEDGQSVSRGTSPDIDPRIYFSELMDKPYNEFVSALNDFLEKYNVSASKCDIFEETLIKFAGIKTKPTKCSFSNDYVHSYINFTIEGLTPDDANQLRNFIKELDNSIKQPEVDPKFVDRAFYVHFNTVKEKYFPLFKQVMPTIKGDDLLRYQQASASSVSSVGLFSTSQSTSSASVDALQESTSLSPSKP